MTDEEDSFIRRLDGMFVGMLDEAELDLLERCVEKHWAYYSYEGAAALMGFAKVRRMPVSSLNT